MNPLARTPLALAAALLWSPLGASAQASAPADERQLPLVLEADELRGRPDPGYVDVAKLLPLAYAFGLVLVVMGLLLVYADLVNPVRLQ